MSWICLILDVGVGSVVFVVVMVVELFFLIVVLFLFLLFELMFGNCWFFVCGVCKELDCFRIWEELILFGWVWWFLIGFVLGFVLCGRDKLFGDLMEVWVCGVFWVCSVFWVLLEFVGFLGCIRLCCREWCLFVFDFVFGFVDEMFLWVFVCLLFFMFLGLWDGCELGWWILVFGEILVDLFFFFDFFWEVGDLILVGGGVLVILLMWWYVMNIKIRSKVFSRGNVICVFLISCFCFCVDLDIVCYFLDFLFVDMCFVMCRWLFWFCWFLVIFVLFGWIGFCVNIVSWLFLRKLCFIIWFLSEWNEIMRSLLLGFSRLGKLCNVCFKILSLLLIVICSVWKVFVVGLICFCWDEWLWFVEFVVLWMMLVNMEVCCRLLDWWVVIIVWVMWWLSFFLLNL